MTHPAIPPSPETVCLRPLCPRNLDEAWLGERWVDAAVFARQQQKSAKDKKDKNYYHVVELAAWAHAPDERGINGRIAAKAAVEDMAKQNTPIDDAACLDLYEFACSKVALDYSETIGLLRSRFVKAQPKLKASALRCFDACLWHLDWENAQQIAALLDKKFSEDRKFLFRNILTTYLAACTERCPDNKKQLFLSLAKAQADRAFDLHAKNVDGQDLHPRAVTNETEHLMWCELRILCAKPEDNLKLFTSSKSGPLAFLEHGFDRSYHQTMHYLHKSGAWAELFEIGQTVAGRSVAIYQEEGKAYAEAVRAIHQNRKDGEDESTTEKEKERKRAEVIQKSRASLSTKDRRYEEVCCDYFLWKAMVVAAKHQSDTNQKLEETRQLAQTMLEAKQQAEGKVKSVFRKNFHLLTLEILFARASETDEELADGSEQTTRVERLEKYIDTYYKDRSCFDDIKPFFSSLSKDEAAIFLKSLGTSGDKNADNFKGLMILSMRLKLRFLQATSASSGEKCDYCSEICQDTNCTGCLKSIAKGALDNFSSGIKDADLLRELQDTQDDPLSDMTMIGSVCLLNLAGVGRGCWDQGASSPFYETDTQYFLQAVTWVELYVRMIPRNDPLRMLLVKLYLLMGCVSRAKILWDSFGVKNAIVNSLGSLFFDRLSTISPRDFVNSITPTDKILRVFSKAIRKDFPNSIRQSLQYDNYWSVAKITKSGEDLSRSCALVMAVVEGRRGLRLGSDKGGAVIDDEPLIRNHALEHQLIDSTDYSYLPDFGGPNSKPTKELLSYGPPPSHERSHLSILAERFLDFVSCAQPRDYKPPKKGLALQFNWDYAVTTCKQIEQGIGVVLPAASKDHLTGAERWYYSVVLKLAVLVRTILDNAITTRSTGQVQETVRSIIVGLLDTFETQTNDLVSVPNDAQAKIQTVYGAAPVHAMGMVRESTQAIKHTVRYVTAAVDRIKATDKTRGASEAAWLGPELKKMTTAASDAELKVKDLIKQLNSKARTGGWVDRLNEWTFGDRTAPADPEDKAFRRDFADQLSNTIPRTDREFWADSVATSWQELFEGWKKVKWE